MTAKAEKSDKEPIRLSDLQNTGGKGLACRKCGCRRFRVLHTRLGPESIQRERQCCHCEKVVWTREKIG